MLKILFLYGLLSVLSVVSGEETQTRFVATSQIARHGQFPYVVGLQYEKSEDRFVGALISSQFVLTVAERIVENKVLHVYLGAHRFNKLHELGRVNLVVNVSTDVIVHPEYESGPNVLDNLALVRLPQPVTFSEFIHPIALPNSVVSAELFDEEVVYVPGWGAQRPMYLPAKVLHFINVTVVPYTRCYEVVRIETPQLCLDSSTGRTICQGDDGAPISVVRNGEPLLIGLANLPERCVPGQPQVALRLTSYIRWIEHTMEDFDELQ